MVGRSGGQWPGFFEQDRPAHGEPTISYYTEVRKIGGVMQRVYVVCINRSSPLTKVSDFGAWPTRYLCADAMDWLVRNVAITHFAIGRVVGFELFTIAFLDEFDALAFKLRWHGAANGDREASSR